MRRMIFRANVEEGCIQILGSQVNNKKVHSTRGEGRGVMTHITTFVVRLDEFVEHFLPGCIDNRYTDCRKRYLCLPSINHEDRDMV